MSARHVSALLALAPGLRAPKFGLDGRPMETPTRRNVLAGITALGVASACGTAATLEPAASTTPIPEPETKSMTPKPAPALPTLFVSHGAPNLILQDIPVRTLLAQLANEVP